MQMHTWCNAGRKPRGACSECEPGRSGWYHKVMHMAFLGCTSFLSSASEGRPGSHGTGGGAGDFCSLLTASRAVRLGWCLNSH